MVCGGFLNLVEKASFYGYQDILEILWVVCVKISGLKGAEFSAAVWKQGFHITPPPIRQMKLIYADE